MINENIMEDLKIELRKKYINYLKDNEEKEHVKQKGGKKGKLVKKRNVKIIDVNVDNNDLELNNEDLELNNIKKMDNKKFDIMELIDDEDKELLNNKRVLNMSKIDWGKTISISNQ